MENRREESQRKAQRLRRLVTALELTERVEMLGALEDAYRRLAPYYMHPEKPMDFELPEGV